jgi:transposase
MCDFCHIARTVCVIVSASDKALLEAHAVDRNRPQKHAERARAVLASMTGDTVQRVANPLSVSSSMSWRWHQRLAEAGVNSLLRDKTRKPSKPPIATETVTPVMALTCADPPLQATHWTGRAVAEATGISLWSAQRIWAAHQLQPPRLHIFPRSRNPVFATTLTAIVCLYFDPPAHAVVLSIDENSQIQELDRTQSGLPIRPGRCGAITHNYKRDGTTTWFAVLNVLDGRRIVLCTQRHGHEEFICFLKDTERLVPAGKLIKVVFKKYLTQKPPSVRLWLERHPRWTFHFTPASGFSLNAAENFFSVLHRKRLHRRSFHSLFDLQSAIKRQLTEHNAELKPFG